MAKIQDVLPNVTARVQSRAGIDTAMNFQSMPTSLCNPDCETCGGSGYVRLDVSISDSRFGKLYPCPSAPLFSSVWNVTGLSVAERSYDWSMIRSRKEIEANESLKQAVKVVKEVMERKRGLVLLYGGNGLAKSLILKIAVAETIRQQRGAIGKYILMPDLVEDLRASYDEERAGASLREATERYKAFPVLAIDELGVERDTSFTEEKRFIIIDHRYNAAIENKEPLITLLATNLSIEEFPPRIADRLSDGRCHVVKMVGQSARPGMKLD